MKQFMKDFVRGFKEGCLDLAWLAEEIWMWCGVIIAYVISTVMIIPVAIFYLVIGLLLVVIRSFTWGKGRSIIEGMINRLFLTAWSLTDPAMIVFSWLIPERYVMSMYLRKTEEIRRQKSAS